MEFKALLFDTRSIQRYIYSSNRLKANIGASYLVDRVFYEDLLNVLRSKLGVDETTWEIESPDWTRMEEKSRIAYIGGGNALILFRNDVSDADVDLVVTQFTEKLLQSHPGLQTGVAQGVLHIGEGEDEKGGLTCIRDRLKGYQNSVFPEVNLPYTGLTQICPETGETATTWQKGRDGEKGRFCSWEFKAKLDAADKAENAIVEKIQDVLSETDKTIFDKFMFPTELEKLGQRETENYIAIVHIDGNNMGEKFAGMKTLTDRKNLSRRLSRKTKVAFAELLRKVVGEYESYGTFLSLGEDNRKKILPLRPLVLGGDDMTFICTAKLALRYTRWVMEAMQAQDETGESVDTCAGVAIQPASYPFFRGYTLAEQACDAAKKEMRKLRNAAPEKREEKSCWLDFVIRHGEQAPTLSDIRKQEYRTREGYDMHFGPYRVDAAKSDERALENLLAGLDALKKEDYAKQRLAMNKIKKLRDVVRHGAHEWEKFRQRLDERVESLQAIGVWKDYAETLWKDKRTPYIDLIEMMDFYEPEGGEGHGTK